MSIPQSDASVFFTDPLSAAILAIAAIAFIAPLVIKLTRNS
jgi:TctA family transporter